MIPTILTTLLQACCIALLLAIELSVGLPFVSMTVLLIFVRHAEQNARLFLVLSSALCISSLSGIALSSVLILLASVVVLAAFWQYEQRQVRLSIIILGVVATFLLGLLAGVTLQLRTVLYGLLFGLSAYGVAKLFLQQRTRQRFIEWISPGVS